MTTSATMNVIEYFTNWHGPENGVPDMEASDKKRENSSFYCSKLCENAIVSQNLQARGYTQTEAEMNVSARREQRKKPTALKRMRNRDAKIRPFRRLYRGGGAHS